MPLFPPAKLEWETRSVNIPSKKTSVEWPPKDWRSMTPDQKLMQWEFVAMTLNTANKDHARLERTELQHDGITGKCNYSTTSRRKAKDAFLQL